MGLGTKIKGALSGDKGHHYTTSQQPRITPGAYPDSVVDVPRSATVATSTRNRTWETTPDTTSKKQHPSATKDHTKAEKDEPDEYTYLPVNVDSSVHPKNIKDMESSQNEDEEELVIPSPDSRTAAINHSNHPAFSKDSSNLQQHPYWGDIGKIDAQKEDVGTNGRHLGRNGTINNGNYSTRHGQAGTHGYDHDEKFGPPISATINHGQPQMADEEAQATNLAATQLSQPKDFDRDNGPVDLAYRTTGHGNGNTGYDMNYPVGSAVDHYDENYGVKRTPTVNGRGPSPTNARGTFGSPSWELNNNVQRNTYQAGSKSGQQQYIKEREQSGSVGGSSDGITADHAPKSAGVDHYGPGHSGAKVLHRCEHCGNDNDITRYFNRDVVYRLS